MMWMLEGLLSIDLMIFEFYEKKLLGEIIIVGNKSDQFLNKP